MFPGSATLRLSFYTFLIPTLTAQWSMSQSEAGIVASSALITSALGGWLTGILADGTVACGCCRLP